MHISINRDYIGIVICVLLYAVLIITRPVGFAGPVVSYLPVFFLTLCLCLIACAFFVEKANSKFTFFHYYLELRTKSLVVWIFLSFLLVGSQLLSNWSGEILSYFYVGGFLPNSDAGSYYDGARELLINGSLNQWSSRRPMMTTYLSSALVISHFYLVVAISLISAIAAISIALVTASLRRTEPLGVALWAFVLMFFFYNGYVGTTLSENLGLTFGGVAFAILWSTSKKKSIFLYALGIFFMTLAQVTRSGAVLVPPLLVFWGTFWLARDFRARMVHLLVGVISIVLGIGVNRTLLLAGGGDPALAFSNFADTLYGLSVATQLSVGHGWRQVFVDHPDIASLAEPLRSRAIYRLAIDNIISQPGFLIGALADNFKSYVLTDGGLNLISGTKAWVLVQLPSLLGAFWCIRHFKTPHCALLLLVITGVLISATIIAEDGGIRVFAATVPFSATIAALGLRWIYKPHLNENRGLNKDINGERSARPERYAAYIGVVLVVGLFLTVLIAPLGLQAKSEYSVSCKPGRTQANIHFPARSAVHLLQEKDNTPINSFSIKISDLPRMLKINERDWPDIDEVKPIPLSLVLADKFYLLSTKRVLDDPEQLVVCVEKNEWLYVSENVVP